MDIDAQIAWIDQEIETIKARIKANDYASDPLMGGIVPAGLLLDGDLAQLVVLGGRREALSMAARNIERMDPRQ